MIHHYSVKCEPKIKLCKGCFDSINLVKLVPMHNYCARFEFERLNDIEHPAYLYNYASIESVEIVDGSENDIVLHKKRNTLLSDFLKLPKIATPGNYFTCTFCFRRIKCWCGVCYDCHNMRDKLYQNQLFEFSLNNDLPMDVINYVIGIGITGHNSFKEENYNHKSLESSYIFS